jgi:predicted regulator of Ras-like GTPase activity (Roadblock/LC7/MglB family)
MPGLEEKLKDILLRLNQAAPSITASAVVSIDGLMLASALPPETNEDDVAALSATLLGLGERTVHELRQGMLRQVYVKGDRGFTIVTSTGQDNVLVVVTDESAKLGVIFLHVKHAAGEINSSFLHLLETPENQAPPTA